jgi:hypothetical protein
MGDFPNTSEAILYAGDCPYEAGDLVEHSGIYAICHRDGTRHTLVLIRGNLFPPCGCCASEVRYRLLRSAPYIFDDLDFAPDA